MVCAYRSHTDVILILPAGKAHPRCQDKARDDVRRNFKNARWKHNLNIFLTSESIIQITLQLPLNDGCLLQNECKNQQWKCWPLTSCSAEPGAGRGTNWGSRFTPESSGPAVLLLWLAWGWRGGLVDQLQRNHSGLLHSSPFGQSLQKAGSP